MGVAFDGSHIWVTNHNSDNVTELNASDGSTVQTVSVGTPQLPGGPMAAAFDGANVWVANNLAGAVLKV